MNSKNAALYDEKSRRILSNKRILANVMKAVIPEYTDLSISEIVNLIEDGSESRLIKGMQNEDIRLDGAPILYDIVFTSRLPGSDDEIGMIINVEEKVNPYPGYPLLSRAVYYLTRLFSKQAGEITETGEYRKFKKVYTIWICPTPPVYKRDSVKYIHFMEDGFTGDFNENLEEYDYLHIVMIYVGSKTDKKDKHQDIIEMFRLIFLDEETNSKNKTKILNERYDIMLNEQEVLDMPSYAEGFYQNGYREGMEQGLVQGLQEGKLTTLIDNINSLMGSGMSFEEITSILKLDDDTINIVKQKLNI
ncbi:MAG: hypothetical protein Q4B60_04285 [Erysipelotrichaceae bacterium]|nr:hypothetical protein [Erysipelotrichaceae bacterium]